MLMIFKAAGRDQLLHFTVQDNGRLTPVKTFSAIWGPACNIRSDFAPGAALLVESNVASQTEWIFSSTQADGLSVTGLSQAGCERYDFPLLKHEGISATTFRDRIYFVANRGDIRDSHVFYRHNQVYEWMRAPFFAPRTLLNAGDNGFITCSSYQFGEAGCFSATQSGPETPNIIGVGVPSSNAPEFDRVYVGFVNEPRDFRLSRFAVTDEAFPRYTRRTRILPQRSGDPQRKNEVEFLEWFRWLIAFEGKMMHAYQLF